jgi:hypothetical protein
MDFFIDQVQGNQLLKSFLASIIISSITDTDMDFSNDQPFIVGGKAGHCRAPQVEAGAAVATLRAAVEAEHSKITPGLGGCVRR